jgi:hypothetical protein
MDELFCDQTRAYGANSAAEADPSAVTIYEQLKDAVEQVGKALAEDEELTAVWHSPAGEQVMVEQIGYLHQTLIVLRWRDADGAECTALVPARAAHLILRKVKKTPGVVRSPVGFMGHSVTPAPPADTPA